jgi:hypothetical protein
MDEQAKMSIIRIYKKQDSKMWPIGCGFLAGGRSILTCWHVVRDALFPEKDLLGKEVELDFPFAHSSAYLKAKVILAVEQPDLAKLELLSDPPETAISMPLSTKIVWGNPYSAFGIMIDRPEGCWNDGVIKSKIADGTIQLESKSVFKVEQGFSGTAVWDDHIKKVVGMIVTTESDQETKAAYAIPMADLLEICRDLNQYPVATGIGGHREFHERKINEITDFCMRSIENRIYKNIEDLNKANDDSIREKIERKIKDDREELIKIFKETYEPNSRSIYRLEVR